MEIKELERLNLANLGKGAAEEKFADALAKVIENIQDLNTDHKARRTITLKVHFLPTEKRLSAKILLDVATTLPAPQPFETQIYLGIEDGEYIATEFNPQQMLLFDPPKPNVRPIKEENGQEG